MVIFNFSILLSQAAKAFLNVGTKILKTKYCTQVFVDLTLVATRANSTFSVFLDDVIPRC